MTQAPSPGFIAVAPVFNEAESIDEFLRRMVALGETLALEGLVIVDDGSEDATLAIVSQFARSSRLRLRVVRLSRNFGHQNAVLAGLEYAHRWAREERIAFIGLLDADLQDQPEHFRDLLAHADEADVIYATRASRTEGFVVRNLADAFHWMLSRISRFPIPRGAGTFSVMRTEVAEAILRNADPDPYFPGIRAWVGYRQIGVPLPRSARHAGDSRVGLRGLFQLALRAVFAYSNAPQTLFMWISFGTLLLSILAILVFASLRLLGYLQEVQGITTIIVAIFLSLGIQSVYLTLVTYMIGRLGQQRPKEPFVVADVLRPDANTDNGQRTLR
jgi:polyisoprenyl-phosphate glycosyltransferase